MGEWGREAIEVFCVTHLITCALDADEENIMMDFHFSVRLVCVFVRVLVCD